MYYVHFKGFDSEIDYYWDEVDGDDVVFKSESQIDCVDFIKDKRDEYYHYLED